MAYVRVVLITSCVQNRHRGVKPTLHEVMILLSFLKPCVDVYRLCIDVHSRVEGAPLDRMAELSALQFVAMVFQSIPTSLMHAQMFLSRPRHQHSAVQFVCVLLSCLAIGFTSASIAFDIDTNPDYVNADPRFYGYVLPTRRTSTFCLLLLFQTVHVLLKISGMACLLVLSPIAFHSYFWVRLLVVAPCCSKSALHWHSQP
jgi:hypothetical protein